MLTTYEWVIDAYSDKMKKDFSIDTAAVSLSPKYGPLNWPIMAHVLTEINIKSIISHWAL